MGTITLSKLNTWAKGKTFVETGSMEGWTMLIAQEYGFEVMHGIELMPKYYESSKIRLKNHSNVKFWLGESPDVLRELCPTLTEPATFWLDAHASVLIFREEYMVETHQYKNQKPLHFHHAKNMY